MKVRLAVASGLIAMVLFGIGMHSSVQAASSVAQGIIGTASPCGNPAGYVFTVGTSNQKYIFRSGVTTTFPPAAIPVSGQTVFITASTTATCSTGSGAAATSISGLLVTYLSVTSTFSTPTPTPPQPPNQGGQQNPPSTGGSGGTGFPGLPGLPTGGQTGTQTGSQTGTQTGTQNQTNQTSSPGGGLLSPFNFGGTVATPIICDPAQSFPTGSIWMVTIAGPKPGLFLYNPALTKSYLNGPPLIPGQNTLGSYTPGATCDVCPGPHCYTPVVATGWMNALPGHGTSLGPGAKPPASSSGPVKPSGSQNDYCKNPAYDQYTKNALDQYGGNLLNGNIPGIEQYCPNFNSLSPDQKKDFWVRFVDAVEPHESGCQAGPGSYSPEPDLSAPSEGLMQMSYGDSAPCHPSACQAISGSYKQYDPKNPNQPIYDPQNNLNCAIAKMDCFAPGGTNNIARAWSVLQPNSSHSQVPAISAVTQAFPGCK